MIEFIISILVPILGGLGVSEADVTTYVTNCSGYIYAILISILVLIVLLVAAHFIAPKGKRHLVRWGASLAWVLALVTMVNMVCYGPLYTNLSVVLNGGGTVSDEAKAASNEVIKKVGEEGMVLVKNNGLLPLSSDVDSMNVFGWASTNPIYGGTGSGSADTSSVVSILQSLSDAGYKTNESLTKMYTDYRADRPAATILGGDGSFDITLPEPTADYYTDDVMGEAESFSDVAMVVISRGGGEGYDLPTDMNSVIHGTYNVADEVSVNPANYAYTNISYTNNGDYDDFDAGESYLELSNTEEAMLDKVCSECSKVIVVINANNPMELDWVDNYDSIGAVILAPGTGQTGMAALGEIINGSVNPSGKTVDTYVKDLTQTPYYNNIGAFAGRNFEYYSEDGVLAGKLAAAQVNAMATKGTYNYIKHFALNDQETNRCAFLLTYSNEQAIREIYLKPFELCIKNFDGTQIAVMSSFNWIGTVPACANEDTLTTILRNEWGFQGMVITDYDGSYGYMITDHCVRTGNDLMLGFSSQASNQLTNTESATLNNALRTSCKNIMYTIANSGYYTNTTDDSGMSNMTKLFVTIDVVTVLLVVLCMALVIVRYRKKHAKTTAEVTPEEKKEE